jgi:WD40 repeat protein
VGIATHQPIGQLLNDHLYAVNSLAFNPNRTALASAGKDRTIILRDVALRQRLGQPLRDQNNGVSSVSFSPDGTMLASGSEDRITILWGISLESWQARACRIANRILPPENGASSWAMTNVGGPVRARLRAKNFSNSLAAGSGTTRRDI